MRNFMATLHVIKADKKLPFGLISKIICEENDLTQLSITTLITEQIHNGTEFGKDLEVELASGNLLSIETIEKLLKKTFEKNPTKGILLNNYPRTQKQLDSLKELLIDNNLELDRIWYFRNPDTTDSNFWEIPESEMTIIEIKDTADMSEDKLRSLIKSCA